MLISRLTHVATNGITLFFLWLSNILLHLCTYPFIHFSTDRHIACFQTVAIMNSAAMNIGVHLSFWIILLFGYVPGVGLIDHMILLFLVFWGTSILSSTVAAPTYIPTNSVGRIPFLHTLSGERKLVLKWLSKTTPSYNYNIHHHLKWEKASLLFNISYSNT